MARSPIESKRESDVTASTEEKLDFDDDTLRGETKEKLDFDDDTLRGETKEMRKRLHFRRAILHLGCDLFNQNFQLKGRPKFFK